MRIIINASDIATVVDKNPFKPKNELLEELCKKYNKNYTKKTKTELVEEKIPLHLKEKLDKAMKETSVLQNSEESQKILANFVEQCYQEDANSNTSNSDANSATAGQDRLDRLQEIIEYATQKINTTHGTYTEHKTATLLNQETGISLSKEYGISLSLVNHILHDKLPSGNKRAR